MRHHNSVLHGLLKHVPWSVFDKLVQAHGADARVRRLSTRSQLVALLYAQLSGAASLREIETAMASHSSRLYHLGARQVSRSTLADANALRTHAVFSGLFAHMAGQLGRRFRRSSSQAVRLIDSTGLRLAGLAAEWASFSHGVYGAKAHVIYDPDAQVPLYLEVTPARVNDITPAKAMPIEPGATYVFDLGYYDYGWWTKLVDANCRIVTRLKINTPLRLVREQPLPVGSELLYDRIGLLPERLKTTRSNRCARSASSSRMARACGWSPTTWTPPPRKSPTFTGAAGPSSCSSDGSSRPSRSGTLSAARKTPSASRSPWP